MRKSIYLLTTTPTHSTIVIHTLNFAQVKSMDDNCGEWVWLVGVGGIYGCGCKEVYRFPHITIPTPLVSAFFAAASLLFVHFNSYSKTFFVIKFYA